MAVSLLIEYLNEMHNIFHVLMNSYNNHFSIINNGYQVI